MGRKYSSDPIITVP